MEDLEVVREGNLVKSPPLQRGASGRLKRWHDRYCVLKKNQLTQEARLEYHESSKTYYKGGKWKGCIDLKDCVDVEKQSTQHFKRDFLVSLRTSENSRHDGRVFYFCAANQIEQDFWYKAIKECFAKPASQDDRADEEEILNTKERQNFMPRRPTALQIQTEQEKRYSDEVKVRTDYEGRTKIQESYKMESYKKRNSDASNGSSGYGSIDRSSSASAFSDVSETLQAIQESEGNHDLFDFSPVFEGPRTMTKKPLLKAKSMGSLIDSVNIETCIVCSESLEELPSLEQRVEIILRQKMNSNVSRQKKRTLSELQPYKDTNRTGLQRSYTIAPVESDDSAASVRSYSDCSHKSHHRLKAIERQFSDIAEQDSDNQEEKTEPQVNARSSSYPSATVPRNNKDNKFIYVYL